MAAPELPVILLEDLGALVGLIFALFGVSLTLLRHDGVWDAVGTAMIGLLLVAIAVVLALEMKSLLLAESATRDDVTRNPTSTARSCGGGRPWFTAKDPESRLISNIEGRWPSNPRVTRPAAFYVPAGR